MQIPKPPLPYLLHLPPAGGSAELTPFVFASPHSGRYYPPDFTARVQLSEPELRQSEDAYVDTLFEQAPDFGATLLTATYARAYLDLNRNAHELDPAMFTPTLMDDSLIISQKVKAGLGLIPNIVAEGMAIYKHLLPAREAAKRRDMVHRPYHDKLANLLAERRACFGAAFLIDCHSMPSEGYARHGRKARTKGTDIVLGDSWGSTCDRALTSMAEEYFMSAGFRVRRNLPYSGGYSTVEYGKPGHGLHALQIEIARGIYMDEASLAVLPEFAEIQKALATVCKKIIEATTLRQQEAYDRQPKAAE